MLQYDTARTCNCLISKFELSLLIQGFAFLKSRKIKNKKSMSMLLCLMFNYWLYFELTPTVTPLKPWVHL